MSILAIRPERDGELEALLELCAEHAEYERSGFERDGQIERWRGAIEDGRLAVWLARKDGAIVGFAAVSLEYSTWRAENYLHLDCIYLRPEARGCGLGSALMATLEEHALEKGCRQVQWQTPPWNEKAVAFYNFKGAQSQPKLRFSLEVPAPGSSSD